MRLSLQKSELLAPLSHIQSVVEKRNTLPILANVVLEVKGQSLSLTATDLDIEVIESLSVFDAQDGATTTPAHILYDIVRKLPESEIIKLELDKETQTLKLSAGKSNFTLPCLPKDDFPFMASSDVDVSFNIPSNDMKKALDRVKFAIAHEETRYYLNGIFIHIKDGKMASAATDGHRLGTYQFDMPENADKMPGIIIPRKTVQELRKLLDDCKNDISVRVSETKIQFTMGDIILTSKLIDGNFPDYNMVIPKKNDQNLIIDTKKFIEAVDRVATISTDKTRIIKLSVADNKLTLTVNNSELGSAVEELDVEFSGDEIHFSLNVRYLLEILTLIEDEKTKLRLKDYIAPVIVEEAEPKGALYVVMPMRV